MKRKDALWIMQMCRDRDARSEAEREAFDTAIEALKRVSFENDTEIKSCSEDSDVISRAEAIDRFCTLGTALERQGKPMITMVDAKYLFIKIIENMPPADGERNEQ